MMLRNMTVLLLAASLGACVTARHATVGDGEAVRGVLDAYLSSVSLPDPAPFDPGLFAEEAVGFWSDGQTHTGRAAIVAAHEAAMAELEAELETFSAEAADVSLALAGNMAWIACRIEFSGTLSGGRGAFHRTVRSTFVLRRHDDRWRIVHEHGSRLPQATR